MIVVSEQERMILVIVPFLTLEIPAMAMAYHCFSMLLMAIHDPTVPKMGPEFLESQKRVKVWSHYR